MKLPALEHVKNFFLAEEFDTDVFRFLQMLGRHLLHADGEERMTVVGACARIGTDGHEMTPFAARIAGLFVEFALGAFHRIFFGFDTPSGNLVARDLLGMTILAFKDEVSFLCDGDDVAEIRILQDVEVLYLGPSGQFHVFASCGQPRTLEEIFAFKHFPLHRVFFHIYLLKFATQR